MTDVAESTKHHVCLCINDAYLLKFGEVRCGWNLSFLFALVFPKPYLFIC